VKKIGLLSLALVLALGTLGVGYAAWTDSITITGSVSTGTVDLDIVDYSNTWVWKTDNVSAGEILLVHDWDSAPASQPPAEAIDAFPNSPYPPNTPGSDGVDPVAYADASNTSYGDPLIKQITVDIVNAFPIETADGYLSADFLLHYAGTIPVKVQVVDVSATGELDPEDIDILYYESNASGDRIGDAMSIAGMQLHYCDYIVVVVTVDLSENEADDQGLTSTISGSIEVKQWNEYTPPGG
jgi:hypothetical protein